MEGGRSVRFGGIEIHLSHRVGYCRGMIYCRVCGGYTRERNGALRASCRGHATKQGFILKRIAAGKPPRKGHEYPLAEGIGPPPGFIAFFGESTNEAVLAAP